MPPPTISRVVAPPGDRLDLLEVGAHRVGDALQEGAQQRRPRVGRSCRVGKRKSMPPGMSGRILVRSKTRGPMNVNVPLSGARARASSSASA